MSVTVNQSGPSPTADAGQRTPCVLHARVVTGNGGGPDKTIIDSPRFLEKHGYRGLCAYMHPPNDAGIEQMRQRATQSRAEFLSVPDRGPLDLGVVRQFANICRNARVSIWHGHDYKSNLLGLLLRPLWSMKLVTTAHGWGVHGRKTGIYYKIDRMCLRGYDRVICVSEDLYQSCKGFGVASHRRLVINNAIDAWQFRPTSTRQAAKTRFGCDTDRLLVGAVGRLSKEKGFDNLIRAVAKLRQSGLDVELVIAGEGPQRPALEQLISQQREPLRYRLLGHCPNIAELYEAFDIFALSSLREGLPNVVLEAMAMEVPVVATRIAGVPGLVDHERDGLLIEPGNVDQLADSIGRLASDRGSRERLAAAGRAKVKEHYSFEARMEKVCRVYDELLAR